jgi:hypothetical protein
MIVFTGVKTGAIKDYHVDIIEDKRMCRQIL